MFRSYPRLHRYARLHQSFGHTEPSLFYVNSHIFVTKRDIDDLERIETGGRLELQRWMSLETDEKDADSSFFSYEICDTSEKNAIDELTRIETQGRVGFLWKRL